MKVSDNFRLQEFVTPEVFAAYGASSTWFIQPGLIQLAEFIRGYFGGKSMTINNWVWGGSLKERGYRTPDSTTGSKLSQHKRGAAIDFNIKGISPDEIRTKILGDQKAFIAQGLTAIEDEDYALTWVHADMRLRIPAPDKILIVRPAFILANTTEYAPQVDEYFHFENGEMVQVIFPALLEE